MTQSELLMLLGEVTAICLESEPTPGHASLQDVVVYLEIGDSRYELIRELKTGEGLISHAITRIGIGQVIEKLGG